jgi:hypothetical protein
MRGLVVASVAFVALWAGGSTAAQIPRCPDPDSTALWARVNRAFRDSTGSRWANDSLRRVLLGLVDRDQNARDEFGARATDTVYVRQLIAFDSSLAIDVERILDRFGLPTRSMVGAAGAKAAMLLVQHNGRLQERVLALAKAAKPGEVSLESLAMMEDRLLNAQGKPQIYGTQFTLAPDGRFTFAPTIDLGNLERRRSAAGIPPMAFYVCMMEVAGMRIDHASLPAVLRP